MFKRLFAFSFLLISVSLSSQDWKLDISKPDIKVWTRMHKNTGLKEFKAEYIFEASANAIVAALMDVEKSNQWYDMVDDVQILKKNSDSEAIYRIDFDFPIVTSDRYSTVKGYVIKGDKSGSFIVRTKYEPYTSSKDENKVLVTDIQSEWLINEIAPNKTRVTHSAFMNPAGNLAKWMVNSSIADGPVKSLRALKKILPEYKDTYLKI